MRDLKIKLVFGGWTPFFQKGVQRRSRYFGAHSAGEIPVYIPNTEVKPSSGDYTALRETSKVPNYTTKPPQRVAFRRIIAPPPGLGPLSVATPTGGFSSDKNIAQ